MESLADTIKILSFLKDFCINMHMNISYETSIIRQSKQFTQLKFINTLKRKLSDKL